MKRNYKKSIAALLLVVLTLVSVLLTGCKSASSTRVHDSTAKKIMAAIDDYDFKTASRLFFSSEATSETLKDLNSALPTKLDAFLDAYKKGSLEKGVLLAFCEMIGEWQNNGIYTMEDVLDETIITVEKLEASKKGYKNGLTAYNAGKWLEAIGLFSYVLPEDENYEDASAKLQECMEKVNAEIEEKLAANKYEDAIKLIANVLRYFPDDDTYTAMQEDAERSWAEYTVAQERDAAIEEAKSEYNNGNYAEAFGMLEDYKEAHGSDDVLSSAYDALKESYITMVLQKASDAMAAKEYLRALYVLYDASKIMPDERFTAKYSELNAVKPTYLCELTCSDSEKFYRAEYGKTYTDVVGNTYDYNYGNLFYVEHNWGDGKGTYSLNYNYAKLKFTLAVDDRSDSREAVFKVVGDGKVLYSIDISRRFNPVVVEIDVSNVNWIEFYVGEGSDYFSPIYALIADAQLTK